MATKAQQHQSEEERAKRAELHKSHVSKRKPRKATWGRDKAHAGAKATHALEDSAPGQCPSRESTRGSANRAKPDSALNRTEQATKGSPTSRARVSRAKVTKVRGGA
jgi:hypothetical protein